MTTHLIFEGRIRSEEDPASIQNLERKGWQQLPPKPEGNAYWDNDQWVIQEQEAVPEWVAFGSVVMVDPDVNTMLGAALTTIPGLYGGLTVGLGQVAQGDPQTFIAAWTGCMQVGLVTPELAAHVAELAQPFNLPADFIAALSPQP